MKIYKISQTVNNNYDTYDSAIVCAKSEEDARNIHPNEYVNQLLNDRKGWISKQEKDLILVEYIGEASLNITRGVILASFNAG